MSLSKHTIQVHKCKNTTGKQFTNNVRFNIPFHMSLIERKPVFVGSDQVRAVQAHKMARGLKVRI